MFSKKSAAGTRNSPAQRSVPPPGNHILSAWALNSSLRAAVTGNEEVQQHRQHLSGGMGTCRAGAGAAAGSAPSRDGQRAAGLVLGLRGPGRLQQPGKNENRSRNGNCPFLLPLRLCLTRARAPLPAGALNRVPPEGPFQPEPLRCLRPRHSPLTPGSPRRRSCCTGTPPGDTGSAGRRHCSRVPVVPAVSRRLPPSPLSPVPGCPRPGPAAPPPRSAAPPPPATSLPAAPPRALRQSPAVPPHTPTPAGTRAVPHRAPRGGMRRFRFHASLASSQSPLLASRLCPLLRHRFRARSRPQRPEEKEEGTRVPPARRSVVGAAPARHAAPPGDGGVAGRGLRAAHGRGLGPWRSRRPEPPHRGAAAGPGSAAAPRTLTRTARSLPAPLTTVLARSPPASLPTARTRSPPAAL